MKRREFIAGAAFALPLAAYAQQSERKRRLGVLINTSANDAEWQNRIRVFEQRLAELGWERGRNLVRSEERRVGKECA